MDRSLKPLESTESLEDSIDPVKVYVILGEGK